MTQDKVSKYKRVVMFLIGIVILGANTAIFGYVWYQFYSDAILLPFYRRGNWLVVGVYLVIYFLFSKIYGGLKVGNARISDIIYSQTLALLFTNAVTYAQISLIARHLLWPIPVIVMTEDAFGLRQPFRYPSGAEDEQAVGQVSDLRRGKRGAGL